MFVYYSCSQNATTEPTSVTQDSTDNNRTQSKYIEPNITQGLARVSSISSICLFYCKVAF